MSEPSLDPYQSPPKFFYPESFTMRDHFAMAALQGMLMDDFYRRYNISLEEMLKSVPKLAYQYADAMLEARKK